MKFIVLLFLLSCLGLAFDAKSASIPKFDSAHSVLLDGWINRGTIVTDSDDDATAVEEIKEQLMFTIGQLNGLNGGSPDMAKTKVTLLYKTPLANGLVLVSYKALLKIAWPLDRQVPATMNFYLPKSGSYQFLSEFFNAFGSDENGGKKCLAYEAHDVGMGNHWYYYRPEKRSCTLVSAPDLSRRWLEIVPANLRVAKENTEGKFPEYDKVWEDGRLVVTAIFGMADIESLNTDSYFWDAGVSAFTQTIRESLQTYGTPTFSSVGPIATTFQPTKELKIVKLKFALRKGELDMVFMLVPDIKWVGRGSDEENLYNERTRISDFVSYSGHSGLGANIRKLAKMGQFEKGQYQIFLINGCDTFAYVDDALARAHQVANPGFESSKFFDIITNAMPSYFHMNSRSNMSVVNSLVESKRTFRQILGLFDPVQRAVVTGEEDNNWPATF